MDRLPPLASTTTPGQGLMNWVEPAHNTDDNALHSFTHTLSHTHAYIQLWFMYRLPIAPRKQGGYGDPSGR